MKNDLQNAFEMLRARYGSHCAAARSIGIAKDHYRAMRNGRVPIPERTAGYILFKAQELSPDAPIPTQTCTSASTEARA